jgi:PKHD-type hydroxylase
MKAMWQMWSGLLPAEACDEIIATASLLPEQEARVGGTDGVGVDRTIRRSEIRWIEDYHEDFVEVRDFMKRKFEEANANAFGVDATFFRNIQFTKYDANNIGHYDWHEDIFWESDNVLDRKLSMVVQLSDPDDYEGGNLEFQWYELPAEQDLRKRGTIIVFPSFLKHRVTPVTKGIRHSLVSWMEGPRWR